MKLSDYDYELPKELIAQFPLDRRDTSNLMVLNRENKTLHHKKFFDIADYLSENDVLAVNNTKVFPARLIGKKSTGANIEIFLLEKKTEKTWHALIKPAKRVKEEMEIFFSEKLKAKILSREEEDKWKIELIYEGNFEEILNETGEAPLPPYINRNQRDQNTKRLDCQRYQTVYAQNTGSVAAPTAGLHFTEEIFNKLKEKNVEICSVSLNVGLGTFKPVRVENIFDHKMDNEHYEIPENTAKIIKKAKDTGKNIVAVGTTTTRALETAFNSNGELLSSSGYSNLFIYPGYEFKIINKLTTNFHLPCSTLLMLVSAFAGKDYVFHAYAEAIKNKYRFYSYGDCMFIF
ncbi:MAG TPA: tRNA preQ1(34) S-adenosylmethionine ribosyltransferase-isomerase QueA [Candidatus Gastranaerophilales bacterium]|nr:tRNA preQ1(34) S-adenosylmethionine ribosyltransferase-isomerase QueA [Candidatus Gastranaerophilales bacterium]